MTSPTLHIRGLLLILMAGLILASATVNATDDEVDGAPLFINLITDDPHRAHMALHFGQKQLELGHPLTVFLNDRGVLIAAEQGAERFGLHQEIIGELVTAGAKVIVCPMCMKHYGVAESDLLDGLALGNPKLTGGALFAPDTRTLTW